MTTTTTELRKGFHSNVSVQGNITSNDRTAFFVNPDNMAHIMKQMIDLYQDPDEAIIREYITNALDSHKEAGQTRPIEVITPDSLNPTFIVEDFGVGMSANDLRKIYMGFGETTKLNDLNQVGAFGMGCKSALSMATQFTVTAIKDGRKTVGLVSRSEDGAGYLDIISETDTNEHNGFKVVIPAKGTTYFFQKLTRFVELSTPGAIMVNGKLPKFNIFSSDGYKDYKVPSSIYKDYPFLDARIGSIHDANVGFYRGLHVSFGGVTYTVDTDKLGLNKNSQLNRQTSPFSGVISIPIGSVDLTPSRDSLQYTPRTISFLKEIHDNFINKIGEEIVNEVNSATTIEKFVELFHKNLSNFRYFYVNQNKFLWKGESVKSTFRVPVVLDGSATSDTINYTSKYVNSMFAFRWQPSSTNHINKILVVSLEKDDEELRKQVERIKRRWNAYVKLLSKKTGKSVYYNLLVFDSGESSSPHKSFWFKAHKNMYETVSYDELEKAMKEWNSQRSKGSRAGNKPTRSNIITYRSRKITDGESNVEWLEAKDMPKDVLYIDEENTDNNFINYNILFSHNLGAATLKAAELLGILGKTVVIVPKGRKVSALATRLKYNPKSLFEHVTEALRESVRKLSDRQLSIFNLKFSRSVYNTPVYTIGYLAENYGDRILDKTFMEVYNDIKMVEGYGPLTSLFTGYSLTRILESELSRAGTEDFESYMLDKYPLLMFNMSNFKHGVTGNKAVEEHTVIYINAVYNLSRKDTE